MNEIISKGYKKTKVGIIPEDWSIVRIDTVLDRVRKKVDVQKKEQYQQIGIRSHGKGLFHKELVSGKELGNKSVFWIEEGCFIVNIVFAWEQAIGKTTKNEIGMIASHRFPMYKPQVDKVDLDYLVYLFKSKRGKYLLELASPGGAGRNKTLGQKEFSELEIPLPPFKEQQKIANILTIYDEAIMKQKELIEEKEQLKKGLMQNLLSRKVRFSGFSDEWETFEFEEIFERVPSKKYQINSKEYQKCGKYPVIDQGKKLIVAYSNNEDKLYKNSSIIVFGDHTRELKYIDFDFVVGADGTQLIKTKDRFDNKFFYYYLSMKSIPNTGYNRHFKFLLEMNFDTPLLPEQEKIAKALSLIDDEINLLKNELEELKLQKKALMQKLLTGEVRVKV